MKFLWTFSFWGAFLLSIPFYYLWNYLAPIYLPTLPPLYLQIPFWHCVGIFLLIWIIKFMIFPNAYISHKLGRW